MKEGLFGTNIGQLQPINVLLVEDNPGDIRLTKEALKDGKIIINLNVATDGLQAINFLKKEKKYAEAQTPDLIFLDLNLPKKDGKEVLQEIKNDPKLKTIPVIIMTSSDAEKDITKSYELNANSYITKPIDFDQFLKIIKMNNEYWLTVVKLPSKNQITG